MSRCTKNNPQQNRTLNYHSAYNLWECDNDAKLVQETTNINKANH